MQLAWSRIWTRVTVSIFNDDNHYTTGTSQTIQVIRIRHDEHWTNSKVTFFFRLLHMNAPVLVDQQGLTFNSSVRTQDAVLETWIIGTGSERESGNSVLFGRLDDDDDDDIDSYQRKCRSYYIRLLFSVTSMSNNCIESIQYTGGFIDFVATWGLLLRRSLNWIAIAYRHLPKVWFDGVQVKKFIITLKNKKNEIN